MTDLRLLPAALAAWLASALAVGAGATTAWAWTLVLLLVSVAAAPVVLRRGIGVGVWLAVVAAGVACASCAAQLHQREAGLLADLVAESATATVVGTVRSEARVVVGGRGDEATVMVVSVEHVEGRRAVAGAAAAVLVVTDAPVPYGAVVQVTGRLVPAEPGDDVVGILRATVDCEVLGAPGVVDRAVGRIRAGLLEVTDPLPPDPRGLVPGVAVGDTSRLPPALDAAMRDVGLTHITAVSGGHFAVLAVTVVAATAVLRLPRTARTVVLVVAMSGFVLLVHPDPSVVRAAAMGAVAALGTLLGRRSATLPALTTAVLGLVVVDPWLARSAGFVLSVVATGGITLLAPVLADWMSRVPRSIAHAIAVPAAAQAVCGPVLVLLDPSVSPYAVLANLLAAPAMLPATVLGVAAALVAPVCPPVAMVLAQLAGGATWWIAEVARVCAGLPAARVTWASGPVGAIALGAATLVALGTVGLVRRRGLRAGAVVVIALVAVGGALAAARSLTHVGPPADWDLVACDVGQGDALVLRSGPSSAVVVDVGPPGDAAGRCLDELGVTRIDLLVLTHVHDDHVGGLAAVLDGRDVTEAVTGPVAEPAANASAVATALADAGTPLRIVTAGTTTSAGRAGEVAWTVLSPRPGAHGGSDSAINDASLVLLLRTSDLTVVALGDAEPPAQDRLATTLGRQPQLLAGGVDVLKVAHHGSAHQSGELTSLLDPVVAVVSVGADNSYGHPDAGTVAELEGTGALVVTTSRCGPVTVRGDGAGLRVTARCVGEP